MKMQLYKSLNSFRRNGMEEVYIYIYGREGGNLSSIGVLYAAVGVKLKSCIFRFQHRCSVIIIEIVHLYKWNLWNLDLFSLFNLYKRKTTLNMHDNAWQATTGFSI